MWYNQEILHWKINKGEYMKNMDLEKGAGTIEWPSQTMEDVCAGSTILIQFKWNFQDDLNTIWASI